MQPDTRWGKCPLPKGEMSLLDGKPGVLTISKLSRMEISSAKTQVFHNTHKNKYQLD